MRLVAYTDADLWGGAEESLATLLSELDGRFVLSVVGTNESVVARIVERRPDARTELVPEYGGKFDIRSIRAHVRAFRELRPDICHINMRTPYSCQAGILAAALSASRIVAVEHLPLHGESGFVRWSRRQAARLYAAHVAVGDASARAIEDELGLEAGAVRTIRNGVTDVEYPTVSPRAPGPIIGTLGRLVPQKGHEVLVEALRYLPGVRAVIVGDGPCRGRLEQLAARAEVDARMEFVGWSDDARGYLPTFDVFVLPSHFEGLPLAVLEAMLAGVPVVASAVGSLAEAIEDGRTGFLVPAGNAAELSLAVRRLLDDPALRVRVADAARDVAQRSFTATAMAASYMRLYEEVVT